MTGQLSLGCQPEVCVEASTRPHCGQLPGCHDLEGGAGRSSARPKFATFVWATLEPMAGFTMRSRVRGRGKLCPRSFRDTPPGSIDCWGGPPRSDEDLGHDWSPQCGGHECRAPAHPELDAELLYMPCDCALTDAEISGDVLVRLTLADQIQHLATTGRYPASSPLHG